MMENEQRRTSDDLGWAKIMLRLLHPVLDCLLATVEDIDYLIQLTK